MGPQGACHSKREDRDLTARKETAEDDEKPKWYFLGLNHFLGTHGRLYKLGYQHKAHRSWQWLFLFCWLLAFIAWMPLIAYTARYFQEGRAIKWQRFHSKQYQPFPLAGVVTLSIAIVWWVLMLFVTLSEAMRVESLARWTLLFLIFVDWSVAAVFGYVLAYYTKYFIFVDCDTIDQSNFGTNNFSTGLDLSFYAYGHSSKAACKAVNAVKGLCGLEMALWILIGLLYFWLWIKVFLKHRDSRPSSSRSEK